MHHLMVTEPLQATTKCHHSSTEQ